MFFFYFAIYICIYVCVFMHIYMVCIIYIKYIYIWYQFFWLSFCFNTAALLSVSQPSFRLDSNKKHQQRWWDSSCINKVKLWSPSGSWVFILMIDYCMWSQQASSKIRNWLFFVGGDISLLEIGFFISRGAESRFWKVILWCLLCRKTRSNSSRAMSIYFQSSEMWQY